MVTLRDVLSYLDWKIYRYSELNGIVEKVRIYSIDIQTEIMHAADMLNTTTVMKSMYQQEQKSFSL